MKLLPISHGGLFDLILLFRYALIMNIFDIAIPFPDISPIIFEIPSFDIGGMHIGPLALRWYALGYIFGVLIAWKILTNLSKSQNIWGKAPPFTTDDIDDFIFYAILGILIGGRIGYVLLYRPEMLLNPLSILRTWEGGMSFHGGLTGVILATIFVAKMRKINLFHLSDAIALASPLGIGLVRIANFINQELWGRPTNVPWAFIFDTDPSGMPRHPSQIYEAICEGFLPFALLSILVFKLGAFKKPGLVTGAFMLLYALSRIILENFREPDAELIFGLTRGMFYSLPVLVLGIAFLIISTRGTNSPKNVA